MSVGSLRAACRLITHTREEPRVTSAQPKIPAANGSPARRDVMAPRRRGSEHLRVSWRDIKKNALSSVCFFVCLLNLNSVIREKKHIFSPFFSSLIPVRKVARFSSWTRLGPGRLVRVGWSGSAGPGRSVLPTASWAAAAPRSTSG